jgi:uncharacterized protein YbjT (DUF2867 family)
LITGAAGVLGKEIVKSAVGAGLEVRQGVRNPAKANPKAEAVQLDCAHPSTISLAVEAMSAMVLMAPPLEANAPALLGPVITAATAAGVQHVVLISAFGVNHQEQAPMRIVEHLVIDAGVSYTILRPNFFMENFSEGFLASTIREQNAIYLAAGDGKTSFISLEDIAAAVWAALQQRFAAIGLTGPAALDHSEVAKIISEVSGRTVEFLTEQQMLAGARSQGMPEPIVAYLGCSTSSCVLGTPRGISGDFETITGTKPITFEAFARSA